MIKVDYLFEKTPTTNERMIIISAGYPRMF